MDWFQYVSTVVGFDFDLDEVWSVRKNVAVGGTASRDARNNASTRPLEDNLNLSVKKNYYSRHGGIKGDTGSRYLGKKNSAISGSIIQSTNQSFNQSINQ